MTVAWGLRWEASNIQIPTTLTQPQLYTYIDVSIIQADFHNPYLNADITEDVYVVQPRGLEDPEHQHKVCKLNKALQGIPMNGKCWHDAISSSLTSRPGYQRSKLYSYMDTCSFQYVSMHIFTETQIHHLQKCTFL